MMPQTYILIALILVNFVLLTKGVLRTDVGMTLTALAAVILAGPTEGPGALERGFGEFAAIAVLFTAIAVPAHMLARSAILEKLGMRIGEFIGSTGIKFRIDSVFLVVSASIAMTYILAGFMHNTTSILIAATVVTLICKSYQLPAIPVLSGTLIASNLGGFSTRWGDTPNIIESRVWGLTHFHFFTQILPINIGLIIILIIFTSLLTKRFMKRNHPDSNGISRAKLALAMVQFRSVKWNTSLDKRLLIVGGIGLLIAIFGSLFLPKYEMPLAAFAIIFCVFGDYKDHRRETLFALGLETYATLLSIFVLAQVVAHSSIGFEEKVKEFLLMSNASIPGIIISSYLGTLFTEAASWATAISPLVHSLDSSTIAAWALGSGICAGSSSLITAATAGIILLTESAHNEPENRMSFGNYAITGLSFSAIMVIYYTVVLSLMALWA